MPDYLQYLIRPIQHLLDVSSPSLHQDFAYATWPVQNVKIDQKSVQKRQGYIEDRDLGSGVDIQSISLYKKADGTTSTLYLTDTNACKRESTGTWSYITETYTTGQITGISSAVVTGDADVNWATGSINPVAGDFFIMDTDLGSTAEPDKDWGEIESVGSDTEITLVDNYKGATSSGDYTIRRVYTVPDNERWAHATVADKFCFTNGNINVQSWAGSSTAAALDTTYATKARYCIEYADRLILADLYVSAARSPYTIRWCASGDPTTWTGSTAGTADLLDSDEYISGLGKVGTDLVIYKTDSFVIGNRTGRETAPIVLSRERRGIGCPAPYSIVNVLGLNAFVGRHDFYIMESGAPKSIGEKIRYKFFNLINPTELKRVYGYVNGLEKEIRWFATDDSGNRRCFVWNYQNREWYHYLYNIAMSCGGKGEV